MATICQRDGVGLDQCGSGGGNEMWSDSDCGWLPLNISNLFPESWTFCPQSITLYLLPTYFFFFLSFNFFFLTEIQSIGDG